MNNHVEIVFITDSIENDEVLQSQCSGENCHVTYEAPSIMDLFNKPLEFYGLIFFSIIGVLTTLKWAFDFLNKFSKPQKEDITHE